MNKPKLTIMVGVSASGKSSKAKELAEKNNSIIISTDEIRKELNNGDMLDQSNNNEVFKTFHKRIYDNLLAGNNVIADATNLTIKHRKVIINTVKDIDCSIIAYVMVKDIDDCLRDNLDNIYREFVIPEEVIKNQVGKFQIPFKEEGFNDIIIDTSYCNGSESLYSDKILDEMNDFDQKNLHHNQTLGEHCEFVYKKFKKLYGNKYSYAYRLAARYHDVGKLYTQKIKEDGTASYYNHENIGAYKLMCNISDFILNKKLLKDEILDFLFLVNYHGFVMNLNTKMSRIRWEKIFKEEKFKLLIDFYKCDKARPNINKTN